jgi:hypothetical protein
MTSNNPNKGLRSGSSDRESLPSKCEALSSNPSTKKKLKIK